MTASRTLRPCSACGKRPALMHEKDCFECYSMKESEREVVRLGRELQRVLRRIAEVEAHLDRLGPLIRVAETRREWQRRHRKSNRQQLRAYNREWMRRYRERQKDERARAVKAA